MFTCKCIFVLHMGYYKRNNISFGLTTLSSQTDKIILWPILELIQNLNESKSKIKLYI